MRKTSAFIFLMAITSAWASASSKAVAQPVGDYRPGVAGCGRYYATSDVNACLAIKLCWCLGLEGLCIGVWRTKVKDTDA